MGTLNMHRFGSAKEMLDAFEADPCMHQTWCLAAWCFVEYTEDRLEYLRRLSRAGLATCALNKEIGRLERQARKEAK